MPRHTVKITRFPQKHIYFKEFNLMSTDSACLNGIAHSAMCALKKNK